MNRLEERYRAVLRVLPVEYRRAWEDDMVAAYLESVDTDDPDEAAFLADYGRPSWSEVASVLALSVRLRLGLTGSPTPRASAWGDAVRLAALIGLLCNAVLAVADGAFMLWLAGVVRVVPPPPGEWPLVEISRYQLAVQLLGLFWIAAFVALVRGHRRAAQLFALLGLVPMASTAVIDLVTSWRPALVAWSSLALNVLVVLAISAYGPGSAPIRRGPWLAALGGGAVAMTALLLVPPIVFGVQPLLDWPGVICLGFAAGAGAYLARRAGARRADAAGTPLALALVAGNLLGFRLLTLLEYLVFMAPRDRAAWAIAGAIEAAAVLAVGLPLAVLAAGALHRLPVRGGDPT